MQHSGTFFVLVLHAAICLMPSHKDVLACDIDDDCFLRIWIGFGFAILLGEISRKTQSHTPSPVDYHLSCVCLCAVYNIAITRLMCATYGFCFLIHSISSVALSIVLDSTCAHLTRVVAGFVLPCLVVAVILWPCKLHIGSVAFFQAQQTQVYHDQVFEAAHMCAIFFASFVRVIVTILFFLWHRL